MFRDMRRGRQALDPAECRAILERASSCVLALAGDDGYPYAVPISFVCDGDSIYFHSARSGHKLDAIRRNPKASLCVVDRDEVVPGEYTTYFRSVIVFGQVRILEDEAAKRAAMEKLALKYAPQDSAQARLSAIERGWAPLCMLEMAIEHVSGKQAIELAARGT